MRLHFIKARHAAVLEDPEGDVAAMLKPRSGPSSPRKARRIGCRLPAENVAHGTQDWKAGCNRNQSRANPTATYGGTERGGDETTEGSREEGRDHATASRGGAQSGCDKEAESCGSQSG
jgi:hypothetical protein